MIQAALIGQTFAILSGVVTQYYPSLHGLTEKKNPKKLLVAEVFHGTVVTVSVYHYNSN